MRLTGQRKTASLTYITLASAVWLVALVGCGTGEKPPEVVVYTALDEPFSAPILEQFSRETGISVRAKHDTESTKTVGLVQEILAERNRPRCDVFWNNEVVNTLRLHRAGLLSSCPCPEAEAFPQQFRAADSTWHGLAARARVLLVNTELVPEDSFPRSIRDLADPAWKGKCGVAKPLAGTTATHAACLFAAWGPDKAKEFFSRVHDGARVMSGNKQVAVAVGAGHLAFGLTDTDDAIIELESGRPVAIVFPDQEEGGLGTLFIPNTVAVIRGGPNSEEAVRLVRFLLSPEVEEKLAAGPSAQIPLSQKVDKVSRVEETGTVHPMQVDFEEAAAHWDSAAEFLRDEFASAGD